MKINTMIKKMHRQKNAVVENASKSQALYSGKIKIKIKMQVFSFEKEEKSYIMVS